MNLLKDGTNVLIEVENRLKELAKQALAASSWDKVAALSDLAKRVRTLIETWHFSIQTLASEGRKSHEEVDHRAGKQGSFLKRRANPDTESMKSVIMTSRAYPRFFRDGEWLIKVGWSKKTKNEYEHRAPRRILDLLMRRIQELGGGGKFEIEQILPILDLEQGTEIPSYQIYLLIAWLRQLKLLVQHGRRGYSISNLKDFRIRIQQAWEKVPNRGW